MTISFSLTGKPNRSYVQFLLTKVPVISLAEQEVISHYQLLYWQGKHLLGQMNAGVIRRANIDFHVVFRAPCTRGHIMANPDDQYKLSFRQALPIYGLPAFVIISLGD